MPRLPDISEWYTDDRALQEEVGWLLSGAHDRFLDFLHPLMEEHHVKVVAEIGCGSGILASLLPEGITYVGVDANEWFLSRAGRRCARLPGNRTFLKEDVRKLPPPEMLYNLVIAQGFFKHFNLDEWDEVLKKVLSFGKFAAFDVQLMEKDSDDGEAFHHVYVTEQRLAHVVEKAGHVIEKTQDLDEWILKTGEPARSVMVWTRGSDVTTGRQKEEAAPAPTPVVSYPGDPLTDDERRELGEAINEMQQGSMSMIALPSTSQFSGLLVGGEPQALDDRWSLRWTAGGKATLYCQGRRVTRAWRLGLDLDVPADPGGESANTA